MGHSCLKWKLFGFSSLLFSRFNPSPSSSNYTLSNRRRYQDFSFIPRSNRNTKITNFMSCTNVERDLKFRLPGNMTTWHLGFNIRNRNYIGYIIYYIYFYTSMYIYRRMPRLWLNLHIVTRRLGFRNYTLCVFVRILYKIQASVISFVITETRDVYFIIYHVT